MEKLDKKTLVTRRSLKYTYYVSKAADVPGDCPVLLFLHGFPDSAYLWTDVIAALDDLPNKIIVPDCLGYGGTDKPDATGLYAYKDQADDIVDILEAEQAAGNQNTVIIGHDWGSALAQRVYLHHKKIFKGVVLVTTGYMVPSSEKFDLSAANTYAEKTLGYPQFSYWELFTAPDAPTIIESHLDRMWLVLHGDVQDWMKKMFCVKGAMRAFLLGDQQVPLRPYAAEPRFRDHFKQMFDPANGGFAPALQMYKATASNVQSASDATIAKDGLAIDVPLLHILCTQDSVCVPSMMDQAKSMGLVPKLRQEVLESAHWCPMEKPLETAGHIRTFLEKDVKAL